MSLVKVTYSMIDGQIGNIKDYGAKIDGSTNDVSAINNAITDNFATFVPSGQCVIEDSIEFPAGGRLLFGTHTDQNNSNNTVQYDGADGNVAIKITGGSSIENIAVKDISGGTSNTGFTFTGGGGNYKAISAVDFHVGMSLTNSYYNTITAPFCRNSKSIGFFQGNTVYHTTIINLSVNNIGTYVPYGIQINSTGGNVVYINPSIEGTTTTGLKIDACTDLKIESVYFEANEGRMIEIGSLANNLTIDGIYTFDAWTDTSTRGGASALIEISSANNVILKNFKWSGNTSELKNRLLAYTGTISSGNNITNGLVIGRGFSSGSGAIQNKGALRNLIKLQPDLIRYGYIDIPQSALDCEVTDARDVTVTADQALFRNSSQYNNQLHARVFLTTDSQIVLSGGSIEIYAGMNTASNADIAYYYTTSNIPANSNIVMWDPMAIAGDTNNVFSPDRLWLTGMTNTNSDECVLYWENTFDGTNRTVNIYKNSAGGAGNLVASGTTTSAGALTLPLSQQNSSGISGACKLTSTTTATTLSASNTLVGNHQSTVGSNLITNKAVFANTAGTSGSYRLMPVFTNY